MHPIHPSARGRMRRRDNTRTSEFSTGYFHPVLIDFRRLNANDSVPLTRHSVHFDSVIVQPSIIRLEPLVPLHRTDTHGYTILSFSTMQRWGGKKGDGRTSIFPIGRGDKLVV